MLILLALAFQTQSAIGDARAAVAPADSAQIRIVARARQAETAFLLQWRAEWQDAMDLNSTSARLRSLHCHADGSWSDRAAPHLITTAFSRKSMCPIWFDENDETRPDEATSVDNGLTGPARERIRASRATLLRLLDSAASFAPEDGWVTGQRVRLNVDQRDFARAAQIASGECRLAQNHCAMLAGFVQASNGDRRGAEVTFERAAKLMSDAERCTYLDIRVFIDSRSRKAYEALTCEARSAINTRFWWLADPLYTEPRNERLAVHLFRETLVLLHSALTIDERNDWRVRYGSTAAAEMLLRYGWPAVAYWDKQNDLEHFGWMGFRDSSINASREYLLPRFHTTPKYAGVIDLEQMGATDLTDIAPKWNRRREKWDEDWWPVEHFARGAPLVPLDYQVVMFRRSGGPLVAIATRPASDLIPDSVLARYVATLMAVDGPTDSARRSIVPAMPRPTGTLSLSVETTPGMQVLSAEIIAEGGGDAPAARARLAINAPASLDSLRPGDVALSDPALFAAAEQADLLPGSAAEAIGRMLPSADLAGLTRVGVFFEMYGVARGEPVEMSIRLLQQDRPGFFQRLGARIGIADRGDASIVLHWRDDQPGAANGAFTIGRVQVQSRALVLDLSRLKAGHYELEVRIARSGEAPAISRRQLTVRK